MIYSDISICLMKTHYLFCLQLTTLSKMLSHDKSPPLRNLTVLPLLLSPDRDEELLRLTEGRVPTFSHDLVPDYLRTKPEPDVERQMIQMEHKAANLAYESAQVCTSTSENKGGIGLLSYICLELKMFLICR